jgi:SnoaL-like domain
MADLEATVRALARRVAELEDQLAIQKVLAFYGPAVDSGSGEDAAGLWTEDGEYDAQIGSWTGRAAIAGMVFGRGHQGLIHGGAAHVMGGVPYVTVAGDRAVATAYWHLHRRVDDHFQVWRVTATRWELVRRADGWKVTRRVNRLLDGGDEARQLLRQGITEPADGSSTASDD